MSETYATTRSGARVNSQGEVLSNLLVPRSILCHETTVTGTQLQTGNAVPRTVVPAVTGKTIIPIAWHCVYDDAGTDFTVNTSLELIDDSGVVVHGEATSAISGSADKITIGTILSGGAVGGGAFQVRVKTGDPTGGAAASSVIVRVFYVLV